MAIHLFIVIIYGVLSAAMGAALFRFLAFPAAFAIGAALAGVLGLGLAHSAIAFTARLKRLSKAQAQLGEAVSAQSSALEGTQRDLSHFKQTTADLNERRHDALLAEVKLLQTLLAQVVQKRHAAARKSTPLLPDQLPATGTARVGSEMSEEEIFSIMRNALDGNRVDLHLQPIVQLPSRRPWTYECFSRVRDDQDEVIYPSAYLDIAAEHGLIGTLDNLLLFRCIQMIRALGHRRPGVRFFFNISSASMMDAEFFSPFVDFMLDNSSLASRLIFEFRHGDLPHFSPELAEDLGRLANAGYGFSVDHVDPGAIDPAMLARHFIGFVKIDAAALLRGNTDIHMADLKSMLKRYEITLIATKIEDERTVVDILDLNIDYGQGFLFGEPRLSRNPTEAAA